MPVDLNALIKGINEDKRLTDEQKEKAIEIAKKLYQDEHGEPTVKDPNAPPDERDTPAGTVPDKVCEWCGSPNMILPVSETKGLCLVCRLENTI